MGHARLQCRRGETATPATQLILLVRYHCNDTFASNSTPAYVIDMILSVRYNCLQVQQFTVRATGQSYKILRDTARIHLLARQLLCTCFTPWTCIATRSQLRQLPNKYSIAFPCSCPLREAHTHKLCSQLPRRGRGRGTMS